MSSGYRAPSTTAARIAAGFLSPSGGMARLAVFCYHRVLESPDPRRPEEPTVEEFTEDVSLIASTFNVLTFGEAAERLAQGNLPARAACITFDDGYVDNFAIAAPVLRAFGVPATIFVCGGAIDTGIMWNDLVIEAHSRETVHDLSGGIQGELDAIKYSPVDERWDRAMRRFRDADIGDYPRLMMTREMVRQLSEDGFEIGGHTINHPILAVISEESARREIESSYEWVSETTGLAPRSFAYPNGIPGHDFAGNHERMVHEAGYSAAVSTQWAIATPKSNPFSLPRIGPWWRQGRGLTMGAVRAYVKSHI